MAASDSTVKDLVAGTAGGIAQVLVGQPFDIVKVRMQTAAPGTYSGLADCAGSLLKNEGPLAFYKGTLTPLLGVGACVSIQFAAAERTKRYFIGRNKETGAGGADGTWLTGGQFALAGVAAGLANSVVSGPVEHIRIRLQTQSAKNPVYNGPLDAFKKIYSQHGIRGIYKGQVATLYREASSYALYFFTYEMLMQREMREKGVARNEVSLGKTVLFGAAAGYSIWPAIYPLDMVKSRMQTDGFTKAEGQKYFSTLEVITKTLKNEGPRAFTRGLGPALIRAPFANGATFLGFEMAARALNAI